MKFGIWVDHKNNPGWLHEEDYSVALFDTAKDAQYHINNYVVHKSHYSVKKYRKEKIVTRRQLHP